MKIVIIGGGFAGSYVAKKLEDHDVTLIDSKGYFEFTPGILRSIVEPAHVRKIQKLHSHYLKRANILVGCVNKITNKFVFVNKEKIPYDKLIIASGSSYSSPIKDYNLIQTTRASTLRNHYLQLCKAKSVLIIGGGLAGVELAAEIVTHYSNKKITLVQSRDRLCPRNHIKVSNYIHKFLVKKGVEIIYGEKVIEKKGYYITNTGRKLNSDMAFLCTGIKPNSDFVPKEYLDNGFIIVNKDFSVKGLENVYAIGDVISLKEEKTAQNAEIHAKVLVNNFLGKPSFYEPKARPMVISLGKYDGYFTYKNINFGGFLPAIIKWLIEKIN